MKSQRQQQMKLQKSVVNKINGYNITFEFPQLRKLLKVTAPIRSTIKSQRQYFAMKMDYDFAHMDIKAFIKQPKQQINTNQPLQQINYFMTNQHKQSHTIQIRIIYQGG